MSEDSWPKTKLALLLLLGQKSKYAHEYIQI